MQKTSSKMSKFPVSVPVELHRAFKTKCASEGRMMADVVRAFLERECNATAGKLTRAKPASRVEEIAA